MNAPLPPVAIFLFGLIPHRLALVGPVSALSFLLQAVAVGSAMGAAVALRAKRRGGHADVWAITTAWGTLGLVLGVLIEFLSLWI